jgi:hypothetical protein
MATIGLDMLIDPPSPDGPEPGEALYLLEPSTIGETAPHEGPSDSQASPRSNPPPPNPPFVFPARPSSSSGPTPVPRAAGRRPRSAIEPRSAVAKASVEDEKSVPRSPALPAFSFNPGASLPSPPGLENMFLSPPQSPSAPNSPLLTATRPAGHRHRRGGSEFVGGSIRDGEAITVLNTSPTKSDSGMASPMLQPTRPRRGHAHRRSAAISSHDLSSIIAPPPNPSVKENSVPASPAPTERPAVQSLHVSQKPTEVAKAVPVPVPEPIAIGLDNPSPPPTELEHTPKALPRNRVGFSDTLEYIPRPLSLVSTDTSSTVTARPGHSLSGSISSVISITNADRETGPFPASAPGQKLCESRPSTAGAVMERTQSAQEQDPALRSPRRRGSIPLLGSLPPSIPVTPATPSPTRSTKKWSFFRVDPFVTGSPTRAQPDSPRSTISHLSMAEPSSAERVTEDVPPGFAECPDTPKPLSKKRSKKKKKVKTWAGSILSRKGKHRSGKQKRRAPTPPPPRPLEAMDNMEDGELHMSLEPEPSSLPASENGDWETWTFPKPTQDEDTSYQMIDLDAALGPFNTPLPRNLEWEAAQKAGGLTKKQLHSAAGMSRFTGPGMHYHHRRAESAPEMAPFDAGRLGFPRFGSSSTMADVFEEDEEEEDEEGSATKSTGQSTPVGEPTPAEKPLAAAPSQKDAPPPDLLAEQLAALDTPAAPAEAPKREIAAASADNSKPQGTPRMKFNHSSTSLHEEAIPEEQPRWNSSSIITRTSMDSATPSPRHALKGRDLAPVDVSPLNLPTASLAPISPYSMTQSSAFPSPRSPMSYDAHRISTAPSSITEDNFQSLLMGEPGPEVRISVDDIPSLTSSNSTMTRESIFAQHPQARQPGPLSNQPRPASFTSTAFGRRRSSLASLSRLISSSHGERSKLSMEVSMDSEPEKKVKVSKTKRLSRLVQFWKTKETETQ